MICNTYKQFFATIAEPARLEIINSLRKKASSVSGLCKELKMEQSRVSHQLEKLKNFGFVESKRVGKEMIYSLNIWISPLFKIIDKQVDSYYHQDCKCRGQAKIERWKK